jgi:hypothetical protein
MGPSAFPHPLPPQGGHGSEFQWVWEQVPEVGVLEFLGVLNGRVGVALSLCRCLTKSQAGNGVRMTVRR